MSRVVITGVGVCSPIGTGITEFTDGLKKGIKGIGFIKNFNTDLFPVKFAAEAKKNNKVIKTGMNVDRKTLFINLAIKELFKNCPQLENYKAEDRIMNLGTGIDYFDLYGYVNSQKSNSGDWENFRYCSIDDMKKLSEKYKIRGGYSSNVAACVASTQSMGLSFRTLKKLKNKTIITGGFDSMLCHLHYMGFYKLGALSDWAGKPEDSCRPFDKERRGLVLGEGGVAFLLENEENADKEKILAEITGYSSSMDSYMVTDPHPEGEYLAEAAIEAIEEAELSPKDIDCVHLHGTGTYKNAISESKAMKIIFGKKAKKTPVFSMKGQIGHLIGACGAMEMLGVIYSLKEQVVLPTINYETPDPEVNLNVIKNKPLKMKINNILKLNAAFGGQNTAFVVRRYE